MRIAVTLQTTPILTVNCLSMGQPVTILTFGNRGVLPFVAINAIDPAVIGFGVREIKSLLQMARSAKAS